MAHIFLSYATPDRADAAELASFLKDNGYDVWWDRELIGGDDYQSAIAKALAAAEAVIVLWSDASLESRWVRGEAETAANADKLLPVRLDSIDPSRLPIGFKTIHTVVLSDRTGILAALDRQRVARLSQPNSALSIFAARQVRLLRGCARWFTLWRAIALAMVIAVGGYSYLEYADWNRIDQSMEEMDFVGHLGRFPVGAFRTSAQARLAGREQWEAVRLSRDPVKLGTFLKDHPDSMYAPLAAVRVNRLRLVASGGYKSVIADSSDREVTASELEPLNCDRLWMARNEIFYRAGRCFTSEEAIGAFKTDKDCPYNSCPIIRSLNSVLDSQIMTQLEGRNVGIIRDMETRRGCRLPNAIGQCAPSQVSTKR